VAVKEVREMRRVAVGAAAALAVVALRALAPRLHARLLVACERMFEEMPESFPPKRMLRGIEAISANSERTLEILEDRELSGTTSLKTRTRHSPQLVRTT
jgi:hypothetical protein